MEIGNRNDFDRRKSIRKRDKYYLKLDPQNGKKRYEKSDRKLEVYDRKGRLPVTRR